MLKADILLELEQYSCLGKLQRADLLHGDNLSQLTREESNLAVTSGKLANHFALANDTHFSHSRKSGENSIEEFFFVGSTERNVGLDDPIILFYIICPGLVQVPDGYTWSDTI